MGNKPFIVYGPKGFLSNLRSTERFRTFGDLWDEVVQLVRIDDRDLLDREIGDDLDRVLVDDQHLLDAHAPLAGAVDARLHRGDLGRLGQPRLRIQIGQHHTG